MRISFFLIIEEFKFQSNTQYYYSLYKLEHTNAGRVDTDSLAHLFGREAIVVAIATTVPELRAASARSVVGPKETVARMADVSGVLRQRARR